MGRKTSHQILRIGRVPIAKSDLRSYYYDYSYPKEPNIDNTMNRKGSYAEFQLPDVGGRLLLQVLYALSPNLVTDAVSPLSTGQYLSVSSQMKSSIEQIPTSSRTHE